MFNLVPDEVQPACPCTERCALQEWDSGGRSTSTPAPLQRWQALSPWKHWQSFGRSDCPNNLEQRQSHHAASVQWFLDAIVNQWVIVSDFGDSYRIYRACELVFNDNFWHLTFYRSRQWRLSWGLFWGWGWWWWRWSPCGRRSSGRWSALGSGSIVGKFSEKKGKNLFRDIKKAWFNFI